MTALFYTDIVNHSKAKININDKTNNKSFIRICEVFRQMGVNNYMFPLTLYDSDLIGYDVHNPSDPSIELKLKSLQEAKNNKWFFLRECVRIPSPGDEYGIPYEASRANISLTWCMEAGIPYFLIQPRQTGKTIGTLTLTVHQLYVGGFNVNMALVTKDNKLLNENVSRIKSIRDLLPNYFIIQNNKTTDNKEGIFYAPLSNKYITFIGNQDKKKASNTGRGSSFISTHFDEPSYTYNISIVHSTITAAQGAHSVTAQEKGYIHCNVYTTTPASLNTESGKYAHDIISKAVNFNEKLFYDQPDKIHLLDFIKENSANGFIHGTWSYQQLGKTDEWFHETVSKQNSTPDQIDRDYLNLWKYDSENSIISSEDIRIIKNSEIEPKYIETINETYALNWYITKEELKEYENKSLIIGLDSSENVGKDFSSLVIVDPYTTKVIGQLRCNTSNLITFSRMIAILLIRFKKALFIPERKSTGITIIDYVCLILIRNNQNPFTRIFNYIIENNKEDIPLYEAMYDDSCRKYLGFTTDKNKRSFLYKQILNKVVALNKEKIYDKTLIREMISLAVINGRIDHSANSNDDTLIAYLLANWFIYSGKNLNRYHGLEVKKLEDEDKKEDNIYNEIKYKINELENLKKKAKISVMKEHYQRQIDILSQKIPKNIIEAESRSLLEEKYKEENKFQNNSLDSFLSYMGGP